MTRSLVRAVAAIGVAATSAAAQPGAASSQPLWKAYYPPKYGVMSAQERVTADATIDQIARVFARYASIAQPRGISVESQTFGGNRTLEEPGTALEYGFFLWFLRPPGNRLDAETCIEVMINRATGNTPAVRNLVDERRREFFLELPIGPALPGATVVHNQLNPTAESKVWVTFSADGASPWRPVTRDEFLRAMLLAVEGRNGENVAAAREALSKTPYERWMEEAGARKRTRDEAIAQLVSSVGAAAAADMKKAMEQTEKEVTEEMKKQDVFERANNEKQRATPSLGDRLRQQLASGTPAERAAPAHSTFDGALVPASDSLGHRVLTPYLPFWKVKRSATEPRSITVKFNTGGMCAKREVHEALLDVWGTIDWMAFRRIVDR